MKKKVKIFDTNFSHSIYSSDFQNSESIDWVRNFDFNPDDNPLELTGVSDAELARMDAFEQLKGLFESYNLGSLSELITTYKYKSLETLLAWLKTHKITRAEWANLKMV
jgi:hypothetical protein